MLSDRALEFFHDRGLEPGEFLVGHRQSIRFQVRLVSKADEMRDESQPRFAALQLSEQHVIGPHVSRNGLEVANVAWLAEHRGVADHGDAIGVDLGEMLDDEV